MKIEVVKMEHSGQNLKKLLAGRTSLVFLSTIEATTLAGIRSKAFNQLNDNKIARQKMHGSAKPRPVIKTLGLHPNLKVS